MSDLELSELWSGLGDDSPDAIAHRDDVHRELTREIAPGHELEGQVSRVLAFFEASDDVVVQLVDGTYALVHPTWSGKVERPPWPTATRLGSGEEASRAIARWQTQW